MALLGTTRFLILSLVVVYATPLTMKPDYYKRFEENCNKLTEEPYFEPEMVIGRPWRIYYSWNMDLTEKCLDMVFKNATQPIVNRVYNDMVDYLEMQPFWNAATLLVSMGQAHHEMLLFVDQGAAGRFIGVPNVVRDGNVEEELITEWQSRWDLSIKGRHLYQFFPNVQERLLKQWLEVDHCVAQFLTGHGNFQDISPSKNAVPLIRIHMKVLYNGKYLVMADCNVGVSTLSARRDSDIFRAEVQGVATPLDLGLGIPSCISDYSNADEVKMYPQ